MGLSSLKKKLTPLSGDAAALIYGNDYILCGRRPVSKKNKFQKIRGFKIFEKFLKKFTY